VWIIKWGKIQKRVGGAGGGGVGECEGGVGGARVAMGVVEDEGFEGFLIHLRGMVEIKWRTENR